jgi:hypothetical protein
MKKFELTAPVCRSRATRSDSARTLESAELTRAADRRLNKLQAIKLIGERDRRPEDDERTSDDRARKLIDYAIKKGELDFGARNSVALGDLVAWANSKPKLREKLAGLPVRHPSAGFQSNARSMSTATAELGPTSLADCQEALRVARALVREQQASLATLEHEIEQLRPLAAKYKLMVERNTAAAKKPRKAR